MVDPSVTECIRSIFLHDEARQHRGAEPLPGRPGDEIAAAVEAARSRGCRVQRDGDRHLGAGGARRLGQL
jgi:hypothetical protein